MFELIINVFMTLLWLGLYGLAIYFIINTIKFMKENNKQDKEVLLKINELIQIMNKPS